MDDERREEEPVQVATAVANIQPRPDPSAWLEPIYREHSRTVLTAAYRITRSAADAEDVLQTVFLRLARRSSPPDLSHGAGPYLRRAATNAALDLVQSRSVRSRTSLDDAPAAATEEDEPGPERRQLGRELSDKLRAALGRLGTRAAEMFILRYFEGLDNQTIAELFSTSPGTVAVTLHRARARLMDDLRPYLETPAGGIS